MMMDVRSVIDNIEIVRCEKNKNPRLNIALFINKHSLLTQQRDVYLVLSHSALLTSSNQPEMEMMETKRGEKIHVYGISFEHLHRRLIKFHIELLHVFKFESKHIIQRLYV